MQFALFDTLADQKVPLTTSKPGEVRVYVCGPTTYDDAHIGHARPCVVYDVLVRYLRSQGQNVIYVRNVTDIDDKIIVRARERGEEPFALSARMLESYHRDMRRLNTLAPDLEPKVTETIPEICELIEKLIQRGHAYQLGGDVYFEVSSYPEYGGLSHRKLVEMEAGASERLDDGEADRKRHPFDFALWKSAKPGEPSWPSPWGPGRPGWHIECSAMAMKHLGPTVDLHGGGLDLVFPHHENEIAQSQCATGQCYARHWLHNGFVQVNKEKMSKSLGNFFRLQEAFSWVEPEAVRYSLLTVHYRSPYNLDVTLSDAGALQGFPQFLEAENRLSYLYETKARLVSLDATRIVAEKADAPAPEIGEFQSRLGATLADDLNTPQALAHVAAFLKAANELVDRALAKKGQISKKAYDAALAAFETLGQVLGVGQDVPAAFLARVRDRRAVARGIDCAWVEQQILERNRARAEKNFAAADAARNRLGELGVEMLDTPAGTTWRLTS